MRLRRFLTLAFLLAAPPGLFATAPAATDNAGAAWQSLANGRDLTGWHLVGPPNPAPVTVEDGVITLRQRADTAEHTFLTSDGRYADFILELDLRDDPGFNTGIILRAHASPPEARVRLTGYQVKIDPSPTRLWTGGLFDDYGNNWRWLFDLAGDDRARHAFRMGEWSHFRIECLGPEIKVWVNGIPTAHLIDERYTRGPIAFKIHAIDAAAHIGQRAVRLKNIRILTEDVARFARPSAVAPRRAPPVPDPTDGDIHLPPGFRATIVADNLMAGRRGDTLRFLAIAPHGDVYANTRKGGIFALRDADGDGRAEQITEFGAGGGTGLAFHDGWLYASSASAVYRYPCQPGQLVPDGPPELIAQLPEQNAHDAKAFAFDESGHLFVDVGAPVNASAEPDRREGAVGVDPTELQRRHGGIWRFDANTPGQQQLTDGTRYASGIRHVVALAWNPIRHAFFFVMHGRDQLHTVAPQFYSTADNAELPGEEMHLLREDGDYGWPTTYWDPLKGARMRSPEWGGDGHQRAEPGRYPAPLLSFPAHWAPLQMAFNDSQQFPDHYLHGMFVAFHGSWNRGPEPQQGYVVGFVPFAPDGLPVGDYEVFAAGFAGRDLVKSPGEARFRPCGLAFGPDGTLYVGDSEKGRIWRIVYTGEKTSVAPPLAPAGAPPAAFTSTTPTTRGSQLYAQLCAACHMADGSGVSGMQPALAGSSLVAADAENVARIIRLGSQAAFPPDHARYANLMPGFGSVLSDADVAALVDYVRQTFTAP